MTMLAKMINSPSPHQDHRTAAAVVPQCSYRTHWDPPMPLSARLESEGPVHEVPAHPVEQGT